MDSKQNILICFFIQHKAMLTLVKERKAEQVEETIREHIACGLYKMPALRGIYTVF
ncbi:MAG: hypothetical protein RR357_02285 [Clostridia bacterium]